MSRWFRHYAGMMRDDKLVSVAIRSKQTIERVVWVWGAILESAAEIDDEGTYHIDTAEMAYFLRADECDIDAVVAALVGAGRITESRVARWSSRQFHSDRSAERQARYRARQKGAGDGDDVSGEAPKASPSPSQNGRVTSLSRHGDAPDTETETDNSVAKATGGPPPDPLKELFDLGVSILEASGHSEKQARSLIGKWRKASDDAEVLKALLECRTKAISNPVEWMQKRLRGAEFVSSSGYQYRGDAAAVMKEAERRGDWATYWEAKRATGPPKQQACR